MKWNIYFYFGLKTAIKKKILLSFASIQAKILKLVAMLKGSDNDKTGDHAVSSAEFWKKCDISMQLKTIMRGAWVVGLLSVQLLISAQVVISASWD